MQLASSMLTGLDVATRHRHREADAPWHEITARRLTTRRYVQHLIALYGFEAAVESALALTPHAGFVLDLRERARSGLIIQDLLALGLSPARLARLPCASISQFHDDAEALGWLYVTDRATLHHTALRFVLAREMPRAPVAYLSSCDGVLDKRWRELGRALDRIGHLPGARERLLTAATEAFDAHAAWFAADVRISSPNLAMA